MKSRLFCAALVSFAASTAANAAVVYDELLSGDLSGVGTSPTAITIGAGSNEIYGSMGGGGGVDREYFVVTVPTAMQLTSLTLLSETRVLGVSFIGMQAGSQVTVNPLAGSANGLLGWHHYGASDIGTDILPQIGTGFGASGFTGPLPAGSYAFWLQETGGGGVTYGLDLQVQPVPLPAALPAFALSLALLQLRRKRAPQA